MKTLIILLNSWAVWSTRQWNKQVRSPNHIQNPSVGSYSERVVEPPPKPHPEAIKLRNLRSKLRRAGEKQKDSPQIENELGLSSQCSHMAFQENEHVEETAALGENRDAVCAKIIHVNNLIKAEKFSYDRYSEMIDLIARHDLVKFQEKCICEQLKLKLLQEEMGSICKEMVELRRKIREIGLDPAQDCLSTRKLIEQHNESIIKGALCQCEKIERERKEKELRVMENEAIKSVCVDMVQLRWEIREKGLNLSQSDLTARGLIELHNQNIIKGISCQCEQIDQERQSKLTCLMMIHARSLLVTRKLSYHHPKWIDLEKKHSLIENKMQCSCERLLVFYTELDGFPMSKICEQWKISVSDCLEDTQRFSRLHGEIRKSFPQYCVCRNGSQKYRIKLEGLI